jgi:hypothetical protein
LLRQSRDWFQEAFVGRNQVARPGAGGPSFRLISPPRAVRTVNQLSAIREAVHGLQFSSSR